MDNPRPEKVAIVAEVQERLSGADALLLTEYRGLNVKAMANLRRQLREVGADCTIYKNTLVRFAARNLELELDELLVGPTAICFIGQRADGAPGDATAVAKALRTFARENPALVVKGGLLGRRALSADEARALADMPPREQVLAELAGLIIAPVSQIAALLDAVPRTLLYAVQALIDSRGGAPTEPQPTEDAA